MERTDTIAYLSRRCILGEAKGGFKKATTGRENARDGGVSVYAEMNRYFLTQVEGHAALDVIVGVQKKVLANSKAHLKRLEKIEGDANDAKGQTRTVDCDYAMTLLEPVFSLVCGKDQAFKDAGLPRGVKSLLIRLDQDLVKAMLEWRKGQQLWRNKEFREKLGELDAKLKELEHQDLKKEEKEKRKEELWQPFGWLADFLEPLKLSQPITAQYINECRINLFNGIIFTRCITPFLKFGRKEEEARSEDAERALTKLAAAANTVYKKRYMKFAPSFVAYSDSMLPEAQAEELRELEQKEERVEKVSRKRKEGGGSDRKLAERKGRSSAPNLLQGKAFLDAMEKEASQTAMDKVDAELAARGNNRAAERQWIDDFRRKHAGALRKDPALDLEFATGLRKWRKTGEQLPEPAFKKKLAELYAKAEKRAAERADATLDVFGTTADETDDVSHATLSPRVKQTGKASAVGKSDRMQSSRVKQSGKEDPDDEDVLEKTKSPRPSTHFTALTDDQLGVVNKFLKNPRRRAYIERFPRLEAELEKAFLDWLNQDTGGVQAVALQNIFEELIFRSFFNSMRLRQKTGDGDLERLKQACAAWLKVPGRERPGPEELSRIWHEKVAGTPAPAYKPGTQVRVAEAAIDDLLSRVDVSQELADGDLKKVFLGLVRPWLDGGAPGIEIRNIVMEFYESALLTHFYDSTPKHVLLSVDLVRLRDAIRDEAKRHPDRLLTMAGMKTLMEEQLKKKPEQS